MSGNGYGVKCKGKTMTVRRKIVKKQIKDKKRVDSLKLAIKKGLKMTASDDIRKLNKVKQVEEIYVEFMRGWKAALSLDPQKGNVTKAYAWGLFKGRESLVVSMNDTFEEFPPMDYEDVANLLLRRLL